MDKWHLTNERRKVTIFRQTKLKNLDFVKKYGFT